MKRLTLSTIVGFLFLGCGNYQETIPVPEKIEVAQKKEKKNEVSTEFKIDICSGGYLIRWSLNGQPYVWDCSKSADYEILTMGELATHNMGAGGMPEKNTEIIIDFGRDGKTDVFDYSKTIESLFGEYLKQHVLWRKSKNKDFFEKVDTVFAHYKKTLEPVIKLAEKKYELEKKD